MKLFVWRNGWLGALSAAFAENEEQAKSLIASSLNNSDSGVELSQPPEVFESPKSFTIWADVYDIDESKE